MKNIAFATITELQKELATGNLTPEDIVKTCIERSEQYKHLNAVLEVFDKQSILQTSKATGPLAGIPGFIKDNITQKNRKTTCGSKILENFVSSYDATAITRLKEDGALIAGRVNMDEFAMGSSGETSAFGPTKNPWNTDCVPGGSSSGSIAAVAAGLVPWALGSETGGSVRQPAALCGIVGLKPTYGLISRFGLIAYGSSLDQIGIATRCVKDNALVLSSIAGNDPHDASTLSVGRKNYTTSLDGSITKNLKIGYIEEGLTSEGLHPEIRQATLKALQEYEKMGATLVPISLKTLSYSAACYFIISRAEAASNLARFDGVRYGLREKASTLTEMYEHTRQKGFGKEVTVRILVGNYVLSVGHAGQFYHNAQRVRSAIRQDFKQAFTHVDLLAMPTHSVPAFTVGQYDNDKLAMDLQDYFTCPVNLAGIPALSLPIGFTTDKKPIGMQLIGPHCAEELIFKNAYAYEQQHSWHTMHPQE